MEKILIPMSMSAADELPKIKFSGRIFLIGFGGVGRSMLPILLRHFDTAAENITVLEKHDSTAYFDEHFGDTGVGYEIKEIVRDNLDEVLASHVGKGDLVVNLSLNIDGLAIVKWCLENKVMYIDTSIERWPDEPDETLDLSDRTLYSTHQEMREMVAEYDQGATCVVTHGANPGLVTHFVKAALLKMAQQVKLDVEQPAPDDQPGWAALMQQLGVKVIHVSERDTQVLDRPKMKNEFVCTWSCEGFWAEGRAPAEMGWGTHEPELPKHAFRHEKGPGNAVYFDKPGVSILAKSWAPKAGEFNGFCVQHSEAITISEFFTVYDDEKEGFVKPLYRPTVHYVYCAPDCALVSVHEFKGKELDMQSKSRIAKDEIVSGIDELGVLLMGEKISMWYGSQLGIKESRKLIPGQNATTLQVVASLLGALAWMIDNPEEGYCEPETLPHEEVLKWALPYLGPVVAVKTKWTPTVHVNKLFSRVIDSSHPWAFSNFRVY